MTPRVLFAAAALTVSIACGPEAEFHGGERAHARYGEPRVTSMAFDASTTQPVSFSQSFSDQIVREDLRLRAAAATVTNLRQKERTLHNDEFRQGNSGRRFEGRFKVQELGKLDLLVVIDDSQSMKKYQERLAPGLEPLLSSIGNSDWQIAFTTTSWHLRGSGCLVKSKLGLPKILTRALYDADPRGVHDDFASRVIAGEGGSKDERGLRASIHAYWGDPCDNNQRWVRPGAHYAVLILTDEENCGSASNEGCEDEADEHAEYFVTNAPSGSQFFALLHDEDTAPCVRQGWRNTVEYQRVVALTGGLWGLLCETDYTPILRQISASIRPVAKTEYPLAHDPVASSMKVAIDGVEMPRDAYEVVGRTLRFRRSMPVNADEVAVDYMHDPKPILRRFPLSAALDAATVAVSVNGAPAPTGTWAVDEATRELVFNVPPGENARIEASYRNNEALPATVAFSGDALEGHIRVMVDGATVTDAVIDVLARTVTFTEPPRDGAAIRIEFERPGGRTLRYVANGIAGLEVERVSAVDATTGAPVSLVLDDGELVVGFDEVSDGRVVAVAYTIAPVEGSYVLALPDEPMPGTLTVDVTNATAACAQAASVEARKVTFPCPARDLGGVAVRYDVFASLIDRFEFPGDFAADAQWEVYVDGNRIDDFTRDGADIVVPRHHLGLQSKVQVIVREPQLMAGGGA